MRYVSTRGGAEPLGFCDATLAGLAPDGGLFVPETYPVLSNIDALSGQSFEKQAVSVLSAFAGGEIAQADLAADVAAAMGTFSHAARTPLVQIGPNDFLLELFHGPTLAFKDVAMQTLARLMDRILKARGRRATIITATSGDTGAAAADAFRGRDNIDLFILFPLGRVSEVQRRQMTTIADENVHALAVQGDFDDCQRIVKALFVDREFNEQVSMSGVNSINWARVAAQVTYYFYAALALGGRPVAFTVPTGNFGDILAGYVAKQMGLAVDQLVVATNQNDILDRGVRTGRFVPGTVSPSTSPSMDIQVSSNFERLMFDLSGRNAASIVDRLSDTRAGFSLTETEHGALTDLFASYSCDDSLAATTIEETHAETGLLVDTHTAVGLAAARRAERREGVPMVTLSTAHPAKFPDAVEAASGIRPTPPARLAHVLDGEDRSIEVRPDTRDVAELVLRHARAVAA